MRHLLKAEAKAVNPHCQHTGCLPRSGTWLRPAHGSRSLKELLPVMFLGKGPSPLDQTLSRFCLQELPRWGPAWTASFPCLEMDTARTQPSVSHLKWAWVWTHPLQDNVIICIAPPDCAALQEGLGLLCVRVWECPGVGAACGQGGSPLAGKPTDILGSISTPFLRQLN